MKTIREFQEHIRNVSAKAGFPVPAWEIEASSYGLRTCLSKFNHWAVEEGIMSETVLSTGTVKVMGKKVAIPVIATHRDIRRQIAVVHIDTTEQ